MKVFTFFYDRYDTATTSIALHEAGIDHHVLMHTKEQCEKFTHAGTARGAVTITRKPKGLTYQRNAALDMMSTDEWAVFMCDDFKRVVSRPLAEVKGRMEELPVTMENQARYRVRKGRDDISLADMFSLFPGLMSKAESLRIRLIGFGLHDNPLNLRRKFAYHGLADGRFWLVKKHPTVRFDENVQMIDDVAWTAENIVQFGSVLVCNWVIPYFRRYTADGFGSIEARLEQRRAECKYLVQKYSPLVRYAPKPGWPAGTHIRLQYSSKVRQAAQAEFGW